MLKLKKVLSRYTSKANNKSRRASSYAQSSSFNNELVSNKQLIQVHLEELTDIEKTQYILWWDNLNPSHKGELENVNTLDFLSKFGLPENKLEEIISLFGDQKNGLSREQFFAVLRLIGHAQNDKRINPAYIHIGAPLPLLKIHTDFEPRSSCETVSSFSTLNSPISPFDDDDEYIHSHRSKSYPFAFNDMISNNYYDPPPTHLLLLQPFKPTFIDVNHLSNSNQVSPPPVPPQSTKPAYPKYAKRMSR